MIGETLQPSDDTGLNFLHHPARRSPTQPFVLTDRNSKSARGWAPDEDNGSVNVDLEGAALVRKTLVIPLAILVIVSLSGVLLFGLAARRPAEAATPAAGTVGPANPSTSWTGQFYPVPDRRGFRDHGDPRGVPAG